MPSVRLGPRSGPSIPASPAKERSFPGRPLRLRFTAQSLWSPQSWGRKSIIPGREGPARPVPQPVGAGAGIFVNYHDTQKKSDGLRNRSLLEETEALSPGGEK